MGSLAESRARSSSATPPARGDTAMVSRMVSVAAGIPTRRHCLARAAREEILSTVTRSAADDEAAAAVASAAAPGEAGSGLPTRLKSRRVAALDAATVAEAGPAHSLSSPQDSALMRRKRRVTTKNPLNDDDGGNDRITNAARDLLSPPKNLNFSGANE